MRTGVALATSIAILTALAFAPGPARADDEEDGKTANQGRVVIDRMNVEPSRLGLARVRALVSAMTLRGARIPLTFGKGGMSMKLGSTKPSDALTGVFENSDVVLAMAILVPITYEFEADLEAIRTHLKSELLTPLGKLGARAQVAVIGYAESTAGSKKLGKVGSAIDALDKLEIDSTPPNLVAAVQRGLTLVKNAVKKPKDGALVRGVVVVISDGSGVTTEEYPAITKIGQTAAKDSVRIHALAYSPTGRKRPLFTLGELSRQSRGTFRWIRTSDGWGAGIGQLLEELQKQTVLTFFAPPEELTDKKLQVAVPLGGTSIEAEAVKLPASTCGPDPCDGYCSKDVCVIPLKDSGGGILRWLLIIGGGVVGLVLLIVGGLSVARRGKVSAGMPMPPGGHQMPAPGMPGGHQMPAGAPGMPGAPPIPQAAAIIAPGAPIFIVMTGPQQGQRLALKHGFTIGKAPGSDLDLSHDGYASTNHAVVTFDGQSWNLIDRGSTNGTFVNNNRVQQVRLDPGTVVRLGSTEVRFWTA